LNLEIAQKKKKKNEKGQTKEEPIQHFYGNEEY